MTDEISEEGSLTPKCDVDTDRLIRGQTKDPTNRNVTTNVLHTYIHTYRRNDKSNSNKQRDQSYYNCEQTSAKQSK